MVVAFAYILDSWFSHCCLLVILDACPLGKYITKKEDVWQYCLWKACPSVKMLPKSGVFGNSLVVDAVSHNKVHRGEKVLNPIIQIEVHQRCNLEG